MLKISSDAKAFNRLPTGTFGTMKIPESDLQKFIWNSPEAFCEELGEHLLIIGKEVWPSKEVDDRIDVLAVDEDGTAVIFELKRGNNKLQLFQAISYAGMVAELGPGALLQSPGIDSDRAAQINTFLAADDPEGSDIVTGDPRIILVAESFDYEVLVGAKWLDETHDADIACMQVSLAVDPASASRYLSLTQIYPPPKISQVARQRGRKSSAKSSAEKKYSLEELLKLAADQKILPIVTALRQLHDIWLEWPSGGGSLVYSVYKADGRWRLLCRVYVSAEKMETPPGHVDVYVFAKSVAEVTGQDHSAIRDTLAKEFSVQATHVKYCVVRLSTSGDAENFVARLKQWWNQRNQTPAASIAAENSIAASSGTESQP